MLKWLVELFKKVVIKLNIFFRLGFNYELILPANNIKAKSLIVVLHGYAMNARYMRKHLTSKLNIANNAILLINGPYLCNEYKSKEKYKWLSFSVEDCIIEKTQYEISILLNRLNKLINHICKKHAINDKNRIIIGFSQGARVGIHLSLEYPGFSNIISISGALQTDKYLKFHVKHYPQITIIHGYKDNVVKIDYAKKFAKLMASSGVNCKNYFLESLAHQINDEVINICNKIIS